MQAEVGKKKSKNSLIVLVVAALVLVGGSASAFFFINNSPKIQYLKAEAGSLQLIGAIFEDRYKNELQWVETQKKKPVETTLDISAEWNDPYVEDGMEQIQSIVNGAKLTLTSVYDPVKKEVEVGAGGELASTMIDFGKVFVTPEKILLSLPFTDDLIRFDDDDFGRIMKEIDEDYEGNENLGLSELFEDGFLTTEEFSMHVQKEYMEYLFKELPEKAFTSTKESIEVFDNKINTKKLTMNLSEDEVKTLMKKLMEKIRDDEKLKEIMENQMSIASFGQGMDAKEQMDLLFSEFEEGIDEAIKEIDSLSIPNGIQSTIWHHSNRIVKRDFAISLEDEITFELSGIQLLEKNNQKWDYTLAATNDYYEETYAVEIRGDLLGDDKQVEDSITIAMDGNEVIYTGDEQLSGKERTFTRSLSFTDGYSSPKIIWSGDATHEKDSIEANHTFTVSDEEFDENMYNLNVKQRGKIVKKVDMPKESKYTINLKELDLLEIESYIEDSIESKLEDWIYGLQEDLEDEFYDY